MLYDGQPVFACEKVRRLSDESSDMDSKESRCTDKDEQSESLHESSDHISQDSEKMIKKSHLIYLNLDTYDSCVHQRVYESMRRLIEERDKLKIQACDKRDIINVSTNTEIDDSEEHMETDTTDPFLDIDTQNLINKYFFTAIYSSYIVKATHGSIIFDHRHQFHSYAPRLTIYHIDVGGKCVSISRRGIWYVNSDEKHMKSVIYDKNECCVHAGSTYARGLVSLMMQKVSGNDENDEDDEISYASRHDDTLVFTLCELDVKKLGCGQDDKALTRILTMECHDCCLMYPNRSINLSVASMVGRSLKLLIIQQFNSDKKEYFNIHKISRLFEEKPKDQKVLCPVNIEYNTDRERYLIVNTDPKTSKPPKAIEPNLKAQPKDLIKSENSSQDEDSSSESVRDKESSSESSDIEIDESETAPNIKIKGNHVFVMSLNYNPEKKISLYWLEYRSSKLYPVANYDNLDLHADDSQSSYDSNTDMDSLNLNYLDGIGKLVEKFTWIEYRGTPGVAILGVDLKIDVYFFQNRQIIKCKGLVESVSLNPTKPLAEYLAKNQESDSDVSEDTVYGKHYENKELLHNCKLGWNNTRGCLELCYIKKISYKHRNRKGGVKIIIQRFTVKL